jgi:hypothetical protein
MAMGLGAAKPRLAARSGSAAPQACDFARRGAAGGRVSCFGRRLGARHFPPLTGRELREPRRHQRESAKSPFVFVSERGVPFSAPGFSRMIERAAIAANIAKL